MVFYSLPLDLELQLLFQSALHHYPLRYSITILPLLWILPVGAPPATKREWLTNTSAPHRSPQGRAFLADRQSIEKLIGDDECRPVRDAAEMIVPAG